MTRMALLPGVLSLALVGCTEDSPRGSHLDGPIDYRATGGFLPSETRLHLELDGTATKQVTEGTQPTRSTSGLVDAASLAALRSEIASVYLPDLRPEYSCTTSTACGADFPTVTLAIHADGTTTVTRAYLGLPEHELPAGLLAIVSELNAIAVQLP